MPKKRAQPVDDRLTHSEVMMLFESLQKEIHIIAESVSALHQRMETVDKLSIDMELIKSDLQVIKLSLKNKASINELNEARQNIHELKQRVGALEQHLK